MSSRNGRQSLAIHGNSAQHQMSGLHVIWGFMDFLTTLRHYLPILAKHPMLQETVTIVWGSYFSVAKSYKLFASRKSGGKNKHWRPNGKICPAIELLLFGTLSMLVSIDPSEIQVQNVHSLWATGEHWQNDKHSMQQSKGVGRELCPGQIFRPTWDLKNGGKLAGEVVVDINNLSK